MGGIVKGIFGGGDAAGDAADATREGTLAGIEEQRRQFDITRQDFAPFREAGVSALQQQLAFLGLGGTGGAGGGGGVGGAFDSEAFLADRRSGRDPAPSSRANEFLRITQLPLFNRIRADEQAKQQQFLIEDQSALSEARSAFNARAASQAQPQGDPTGFGSAFQQFIDSPGQRFLREQQERTLLRNTSAIGGLGGGNIRTALQQQAFGRGATQLGDFQNRLAGISGSGQVATQNLAQLGGQTSSNISGLLQAGGQARASGILGAQQADATMAGQVIGGIGGILSGGGILGGIAGLLSDENMKQDIKELDLKACYDAVLSMDLKSWRYIEEAKIDSDLHVGPMYQNAPEIIKMKDVKMLSLHDEIMMISGAIQYMKNEGLLCLH